MGLVPRHAPQQQARQPDCQATSSSQPVHPFGGHDKNAYDGDRRSDPLARTSQNAALMWKPGGKMDDSDDDLPPPIFHKLNQLTYNPAVAHGMQKKNVPIYQLEVLKPSAAFSLVAHTNGNLLPIAPDLAQSRVIPREHDYRGFEETDSIVPLDPNLKCPICGKVFKKGRIQKYKRHVQMCGMYM